MSNPKLFKTAQLTLADLDLHLIQNVAHLSSGNSKILSDLETQRAGEFTVFCLSLDNLF
jgi:hypothetical protein